MPSGRRGFLQSLLSLPGLNFLPRRQAAGRDVYRELGVKPLVNAAGSYTMFSATLMPRPVREAIDAASRQYVDLRELQDAVGKRIAGLVGCEAAHVTAGAASALTLGTAACVTGADREKIRRLPDTSGMKNEVVIQRAHRNGYDHAVRNVGARLVEVETREELERAVNERTSMLLFFNVHGPAGKVKVEEFAALGKRLGVPTLNDAAADVPPAENLGRFTTMGFDLVAVSGGKGLRGPQCSGLLLGRKDLIRAAALNHNPHTDTVGRTNKVGKEEIVGVWAALEYFLKQDHRALWAEWERRCRLIADAAGAVAGVKAELFVPEVANAVPHVKVACPDPPGIARKLREGEPRIETRAATAEALEIAVWTLEEGQAALVARRLRESLEGR